MKKIITYIIASTSEEYETGKKMFQEYAHTLNVDLSFQNFSVELETIRDQYGTPQGVLILAFEGNTPAGCSGVRKIDVGVAELKRMYVKHEFRGQQVGAKLLQHSIEQARCRGYQKIRLDTLSNMDKAQELYQSFGFYEIPSYRFNPLSGTIYMEKIL